MRGQSKRLSRKRGNEVKSHLICFDVVWYRCFLHSRPSFCSDGLSFALCSFGCSFFYPSSVLRSLKNKQTTTATVIMAVYARVVILCPFLYKTTTSNDHILCILENVNYDEKCLNFFFEC